MTVTNTVTEELTKNVQPQLNIADLKTVKWVKDSHYVQQAYQTSITKYNHYKTWPIARWLFAIIELVILSVALFLQQLPWPEVVVTGVYRVDNMIEGGLNFTYDKLDWVSDFFKQRVIPLLYACLGWVDHLLDREKTK